MRFILVAMIAVACLFGALRPATAGTYQPGGGYAGTPSPAVTALFAAYPDGGDGLVSAIRQLIIQDSTLADDVAYVGSRGNFGQQSAAGAGLSQALTVLVNRGDNLGARRIANAAQQSGSPTIRTAVLTAIGTHVFITYQNNSSADQKCTTTSNNQVSPAQPSSTCQ